MAQEDTALNTRIRSGLTESCGNSAVTLAQSLVKALADGSVLARVRLGSAREPVLMAAIASRLARSPEGKALVMAPNDRAVASLEAAFERTAGRAGLDYAPLGRDDGPEDGPARVAIGSMDAIASLVASGKLSLAAFDTIALSDIDDMTDAASAAMLRRICASASPEARLLAFASDPGPAHRGVMRSLASDIADMDLELDGESAKAIASSTLFVKTDDKLRLLLGMLRDGAAKPVAVFCNLRDTAEAAAKSLRAAGVRTEYVLGNLPRKQAVLESVRNGDYDVLVLTDEGADGLPDGWAGTLVNWDLPLEGEPYLSRLSTLNAEATSARVCNFACDRYAYGIPAIEQAIGASLSATQATESMFAPAAAPATAPAPAQNRPEARDARHSDRQPDRQPDRGRPQSGKGRDDHYGQYDGRNARSIQADIMAITGGSPLPAEPRKAADKKKEPGRAEAPDRRGGKPESQKRKGRRRATDGKGRAEPKAVQGARQQAKRPSSERQGGEARRGALSDPYAVSMEERMRLYRERYGARSAGGNAGKGRGERQPKREASPDAAPRGRHEKQPRTERRDEPAKPATAAEPAQAAERKRSGIVKAIKDLFSRKE